MACRPDLDVKDAVLLLVLVEREGKAPTRNGRAAERVARQLRDSICEYASLTEDEVQTLVRRAGRKI